MVNAPTVEVAIPTLSLPEELILMLLNEETGYFHQVPGWHLNWRRCRGGAGGAFPFLPH